MTQAEADSVTVAQAATDRAARPSTRRHGGSRNFRVSRDSEQLPLRLALTVTPGPRPGEQAAVTQVTSNSVTDCDACHCHGVMVKLRS